MIDHAAHLDWFRRFDRIFWVIWAALPAMIWVAYRANLDAGTPAAGMSPEQARCLDVLPSAINMSGLGKTLLWALFAFEVSIYIVLLALLHRMVHRFASGDLLVSETLANLQTMGIVLVVWPLLEAVATNVVGYVWKANGDVPYWTANYFVDVGPIAVGVFLVALKGVLEHAIALKADHDLTI